jgi:hypothetical protein
MNLRLLQIVFGRGGQGFPQAESLCHCPCPLYQTLSPNPLRCFKEIEALASISPKLKGGGEGSLRGDCKRDFPYLS